MPVALIPHRHGHRYRDRLDQQFSALDAGQTTPAQACAVLTGQERLWWQCCHEAVLYGTGWLASPRALDVLSFIAAHSPPGAQDGRQARAVYAAARALSGLPAEEARKWLAEVAAYWAAAPAPAAVYEGPRSQAGSPVLPDTMWPGQLSSASSGQPEAAGSPLALVAVLQLSERPARRPARARVAVVLAGQGGLAQLAYLELREARIGVAGIFPDPASAALIDSDHGFKTAVARAWATLPHRERGRCVLWSLAFIGGPAIGAGRVGSISGGSLGAAFALALRDLTRFPRPVRMPLRAGRGFLHGLRPKTAVTGSLDPVGGLTAVDALEPKAEEVRRRGWRLVAPAADAAAGNVPEDVVVVARNLKQADQLARRWNRRHLIYTAAAALALALPLTIVTSVYGAQAGRARNVAAANQVVTEAEQVSGTNPSLAAQLLLTAYHLDPQSQDLAWRLIGTESETLSASEHVGGTFDTLGGAVAFSPDGTTLATVGDGRNAIMLWSVGTAAGPRRLGQPLVISSAGNAVDSVAFSPDGTTLAAAGADLGDNEIGAVILWDVSNPAHPRQIGQPLRIGNIDGVYSLTFSPDGKTLAVAAGPFVPGGNMVTLWNVSDPAHPRQIGQPIIPGSRGVLDSVAFSPDGTTLAVGAAVGDGNAEAVTLWSLSDPAHLRQISQPFTGSEDSSASSLAFSPDGKILAVGSAGGGDTDTTGTVTLWDISDPAHPRQTSQPFTIGSGSYGYTVAFSPNGTTLAAGAVASYGGGTVSLWDISNPAHPRQVSLLLTADTGSLVGSVAFSPDGTTLAAGSSGGTLTLWSLPSVALPASTAGNGSTADSVTFSPDGTTLAVGANDSNGSGTVTLWNLSSPARPRRLSPPLTAPGSGVGSVAFSPDGKALAVGTSGISHPGAIILWNLSNPARPRQLSQFGQPRPSGFTTIAETVNSVAFSPDGKTLAVGADDGDGATLTLWNLSNPADPGQPVAISNVAAPANSVAFSPDGTLLAVGAYEGLGGSATVTLWNVSDPAHPRPLGRPFTVGITAAASFVNSVAFSPDGTTLAVGTSSSIADTVTLWDVRNPAHPRRLSQLLTAVSSSNVVESVAFSPDGTTLAATDDDTVALWDVSNPAAASQLGQPLAADNGSPVGSVAFSPDGTTLVAGDSDGAQVWNRDVRSAISRICDLTAGELTPQQWSQYIPQLPYDPPCSSYQ